MIFLTCARTRRIVARNAALDGSTGLGFAVEAHLKECADCRAYASDLSRLRDELQTSLPHLRPDPMLTERILAGLEIRQTARPARRFGRRLAWSSTAAVAAALALWTATLVSLRDPSAARRDLTTHDGTGGVARTTTRPASPNVPRVRVARNTAPTATVRSGSRTIRRAPRRAAPRPTRRPEPKRTAPRRRTPSPIQWISIAQWYQRWGDPLRAARAYGFALQDERTPDPGLALEAGRAAEAGGDVGAALEYYIQALDRERSTSGPEQKGSLRWHEDSLQQPSRSYS
jgi:hypothetical protein